MLLLANGAEIFLGQRQQQIEGLAIAPGKPQ
jgi:hypothetical protein